MAFEDYKRYAKEKIENHKIKMQNEAILEDYLNKAFNSNREMLKTIDRKMMTGSAAADLFALVNEKDPNFIGAQTAAYNKEAVEAYEKINNAYKNGEPYFVAVKDQEGSCLYSWTNDCNGNVSIVEIDIDENNKATAEIFNGDREQIAETKLKGDVADSLSFMMNGIDFIYEDGGMRM